MPAPGAALFLIGCRIEVQGEYRIGDSGAQLGGAEVGQDPQRPPQVVVDTVTPESLPVGVASADHEPGAAGQPHRLLQLNDWERLPEAVDRVEDIRQRLVEHEGEQVRAAEALREELIGQPVQGAEGLQPQREPVLQDRLGLRHPHQSLLDHADQP
ncbi:MAG: hypothetical protein GEU94_12365 [Micromonosporaceae bacterium]|nr:hypothetical protein [Micromonosporaceae bacterium]